MASRNVETALAYLEAGFRDDYETCGRLIADGYVWIDHGLGVVAETPEELLKALEEDGAWSDKALEIDRVVETTDGTVITQARATGTHSGIWRSVPPTGRRVTWEFCNILRFDAEGRIVAEEAYYNDLAQMLKQAAADELKIETTG